MQENNLLQRFPFLEALEEKRREMFLEYFKFAPEWLLASCQVVKLEAHTTLVRENTPVDTVYLIGQGAVRAVDFRINGIEYDFMHFDGVYGMGAMEILLEQENYNTTLETVTESIFIKIPRKTFEKWLETDVKALRRETKAMGNYLLEEARNARLSLFFQGTERLALVLIQFYEKNAALQQPLKVTYTRQELSEISGLCVKTINRAVRKFEEDGLLNRASGKIVVTKEQYLKLKQMIDEKTGEV